MKDLMELFSKHFNRINQSTFFFSTNFIEMHFKPGENLLFNENRRRRIKGRKNITTKMLFRCFFFYFQRTVIIFDFLSLRITITFYFLCDNLSLFQYSASSNEMKWRIRHWFLMSSFSLRENWFYLFLFGIFHLFDRKINTNSQTKDFPISFIYLHYIP